MKKFVLGSLPILIFLSVVGVFAQTPPPPKPAETRPQPQPGQQQPGQPQQPTVAPCPQLQIQKPNRTMREGEQVGFAAALAGGDPKVQPIFNWSISSGAIIGGQGTKNIVVDSMGAGAERQIIADLLIGGYSYECDVRASASVPVAAPASKVDEFGDLAEVHERGKLDSIINYLQQAPDRMYIIGYAGRNNVRGYAADVLRRMKTYLAKEPTVANRVVAIDGGFREQPAYELWVVPNGAEAPRPSPTVDRKDIVYPKPPPRTTTRKP